MKNSKRLTVNIYNEECENVVTTPELPVSRNIAKYKNSATKFKNSFKQKWYFYLDNFLCF